MSERELAKAFDRLGPLCMNIVGFDGLAEIAERERIPADKRAEYEAIIRRCGIELAREVIRIADGDLTGILDRAEWEATAWPLPWVAGRPDPGS